jgi:hypothetical protein
MTKARMTNDECRRIGLGATMSAKLAKAAKDGWLAELVGSGEGNDEGSNDE